MWPFVSEASHGTIESFKLSYPSPQNEWLQERVVPEENPAQFINDTSNMIFIKQG
jgi:hypothetical protein